uniref:Chromosome 4 open reading frame 17 n=1 Tax=Podarcis muralis TaxID=64176 RepID=A0A670IZH1_PODMU|nr:uncharacterized protein C4orf17 homolog [Podarcis muralis]XP_028599237.1 uncharacterized protein C4orf17 homolog [Podarcis muralis]XP_028599238.1 uncharacterized protein C4orf17 homolog [Podarcis muralis]XP_028599239.1 uncharacterized protein C4orf17 homolog [Podarcis muralis]XP_028599240.1 uncharacterized protein C4orf17 homolog [Podarcis muralis]XP_028599241.1 uncharacterized protein C4orf17 homolog [Podarcis muralis]XP_028599242.1 uncharacterized protein C4orf17 homolog [Podarcis murali
MNINFRAQPEPQLIPLGTSRQAANEGSSGKTSYFVCRHSPHPKTVCHIRGLNDAPVCVVKDRGYNEGRFVDSSTEHAQLLRNNVMPTDSSFPNNTLPSLVQTPLRANVGQLMRDEIAELKQRTGNTPLLKRRDDPLRKYLAENPQNRIPLEHPLLPAPGTHYRPDIIENMNYTPTYLEQEIKILERLRDILQTDSLAEIQTWLSKATLKEKEFVSNFIRSDVTSRDLLNYQKRALKEADVEALSLRDMLKAERALQNKPASEESRRRLSSRGTASSKDRERSTHTREKIRIPTSEALERSPSKLTVLQSHPHSPALSQNSTQLLYNKAYSKRHNAASRGEARFQSI